MPFEYAHLIERYGYFATFAGSVIEGESLLILSGLAAHRGYLSLPDAIGALVWSACWTGAGYVLGKAAQQILGDLARIERELFGGVIVAIVIAIVAYHVRSERRGKR